MESSAGGVALARATFLLAAFGFAYVVGHSRISDAARDWLWGRSELARWLVRLLECPGCLGVYQGFLWGLCVTHVQIQDAVVFGFAVCGSNIILARAAGIIPPRSASG